MLLSPPSGALELLEALNRAGHQAWLVGGCVRDALLGIPPKDWDICTSALPEEMQRVFAGRRVIETGLKHGTLTVLADGVPYEITTFRTDGSYTDHRHPDGVTFVNDLREDLSRRDFTVNAMAWHPGEGLVDLFHGQEDLKEGIIRCVGEPEKRFDEDALRILRALRFAAVYDFQVEEATARAALKLRDTLPLVAGERIRTELGKLLCGRAAGAILRRFREIIAVILPEVRPSFDFDQRTPYHRWDVWEHSIRALEAAPPTEVLRMTMLLHDSGKPACFTLDEKGIGHAYGHGKRSRQLAEGVMDRLHYDNASRERILELVECHDIELRPEAPILRRRLNRFGEEGLRQLIQVQRADSLAKGTLDLREVEDWVSGLEAALEEILREDSCFSLKQLAIKGNDLTALGLRGPAVGQTLGQLLELVMDGKAENTREALLKEADRIIRIMKEEKASDL